METCQAVPWDCLKFDDVVEIAKRQPLVRIFEKRLDGVFAQRATEPLPNAFFPRGVMNPASLGYQEMCVNDEGRILLLLSRKSRESPAYATEELGLPIDSWIQTEYKIHSWRIGILRQRRRSKDRVLRGIAQSFVLLRTLVEDDPVTAGGKGVRNTDVPH